MITYRWSTAADFDRILDTANRIFSLRVNEDDTFTKHRFLTFIKQPKFYHVMHII